MADDLFLYFSMEKSSINLFHKPFKRVLCILYLLKKKKEKGNEKSIQDNSDYTIDC